MPASGKQWMKELVHMRKYAEEHKQNGIAKHNVLACVTH